MNSSLKFQAHQHIINHLASYNNVNYLNSMHNAISMDAPTRWAPFSFVWPATFLIISETNWFLLLYHISYIRYMIPSSTWLFLPFHLLHIRRAIYFSHRHDGCLCAYEYLCVWMNVNLNELPPCLTFPFAKWEREREIRKHFGPRIETSRYSLCQTRRSFSFLLIFLQKSPVEHAQILSERYVCYGFVFISVSDNIYNCCFFRYI